MDYTRKSQHEWEWHIRSKVYSVRYFPKTQTLIWSGYTQTSAAPVFEPGYQQSVDDFLRDGAPSAHYSASDALISEITVMLNDAAEDDGGFFKRLRGLFG